MNEDQTVSALNALAHTQRLRVFRGERLDQKDAELSCRDVFERSSHAIECIGPSLIDEASQSHQGGWKS